MSIALRHRIERLEKLLQVRKLALDQRTELVSCLAKMFDLGASQVEKTWDHEPRPDDDDPSDTRGCRSNELAATDECCPRLAAQRTAESLANRPARKGSHHRPAR